VKRFAQIGLRLLGVALVVFVLSRVQYGDVYRVPVGDPADEKFDPVEGRVVLGDGGAEFKPDDGSDPVQLGPEWRQNDHLTLGLFTIVETSDKLLLLLCLLVFGPITLISIFRWWYLLREVDIPIPFWSAFKLTFIGFFFNSAVPGLTGGDLVKAFYIAREKKGARARAFMSVLVDRVIGLFALGLLAGAVLISQIGNPDFRVASLIVFIFLGIATLTGAIFLSGRLRRFVRLEAIIARLPGKASHIVAEIDQAVVIYRHHVRAVIVAIGLSLLNHVSLGLMAIGIGRSLGIDIPAVQFFILVPVCMMVASIPLLPGGWGLREGAFAVFFGGVGVAVTRATALSVLIGLSQLAWSLLGGIFFLMSPNRASQEDLKTFSEEVEADVGAESGPSRD